MERDNVIRHPGRPDLSLPPPATASADHRRDGRRDGHRVVVRARGWVAAPTRDPSLRRPASLHRAAPLRM